MTCESYLDKAADNAGDFLRQEEYISYWPAGEINTMTESNLLKEGFMLACGSRGTVCHGRKGMKTEEAENMNWIWGEAMDSQSLHIMAYFVWQNYTS